MKKIRFGLVGCGLMAREFASASARWCHLMKDIPQPEIVGICTPVPAERMASVRKRSHTAS